MLTDILGAVFIGIFFIFLAFMFCFSGFVIGIVLLIKGLLSLRKSAKVSDKKLIWFGSILMIGSLLITGILAWFCTVDDFITWFFNLFC